MSFANVFDATIVDHIHEDDDSNKKSRKNLLEQQNITSLQQIAPFDSQKTMSNIKSEILRDYQLNFTLKNMHLLKKVGTGTLSAVWKVCFKQNNNQFFALKIMKKKWILAEKQIEHLKNEKEVLQEIDHPFAVDLRGYSKDIQYVFFLFDYYQGGTLFNNLVLNGRFNEDATAFYTSQIILLISYLHQKCIMFRDLKPENIMIADDGYLKVIDFGHAKFANANNGRTYTLCGSPEYVSPDILNCFKVNNGYTKQVDWWIVGVIIYQLLSGIRPFTGRNDSETFKNIKEGVIYYPSYFSRAAKSIITKLLNHDSSKRLGARNYGRDILQHKFFSHLNIERILKKDLVPPFKPKEKIFDMNLKQKKHDFINEIPTSDEQHLFEFF